jgi:molybdopterin converting factor subunit 1
MNVKLRLFAVVRTTVGRSHLELQLPDGATVGQLRFKLAEDYPALADVLPTCLFAVNGGYARDEEVIPAGSEVACIPPVSGG